MHALVCDLGGTNLRVGLYSLDEKKILFINIYNCLEFKSLHFALEEFLKNHQQFNIKFLSIAVASPVDSNEIQMTNLDWIFNKEKLKKHLKLTDVFFLNDFEAIAFCIENLQDSQKELLINQISSEKSNICVLGSGTGLGVANLVYRSNEYIVIAGEGGHMSFAPKNDLEIGVLKFLQETYKRVSYERILSGQGIENIYKAICFIKGFVFSFKSASQISALAREKNKEAEQTFEMFFSAFASFAGDLALLINAKSGVYIAGGIVEKNYDLLDKAKFAKDFNQKGRFYNFNKDIPVYLIKEKQPGILGAQYYLEKQLTKN